ncbi:MAG: ribosome recycling factor [Verrucomicrobia bacterium]|nr:ribosome recycling factor [Verrucomicrobiota bacterium]MDA1068117.1 ribosome recycling factor [Verrucomicrobiota bacterium]
MSKEIIDDMVKSMAKAVDHTIHDFSTLHTGKASPSMVENIMVEAYGSSMRLRDMAAITTPDSRTIQIQPWDRSVIQPIEKAIQVSNLGLNPATNGDIIRLPIPELSGDRRNELVKVAHRMAEDGRISVRHARKDALDLLKEAKKDGDISEDDFKLAEKEVQKHTDKHVSDIDNHMKGKEQELQQI